MSLARFDLAERSLPGLDEVRRVVGLPVRRPLEPLEVEEVSREELTPSYFDGSHPDLGGRPFRLRRQQAEVALAFREEGGVFAPLPVGRGKMLASFLCVKRAWSEGVERILLLVPSDLVGKCLLRDVPLARRALGFQSPVHAVGGLPRAKRAALCRSGWRGVYVYPYSLMSIETAEEELGNLAPQVVVADEAHALRNVRSSAIGRRFARMMRETKARFAAFSGTMATRSLLDWAHLALLALRERCFLPRTLGEVGLWAAILDDASDEPFRPGAPPKVDSSALFELLRLWALEQVRRGRFAAAEVGGPLVPSVDGWRRAFRLRRASAPGVVASCEDELGASLIVRNVSVPDLGPERTCDLEREWGSCFPGDAYFVPREEFRDLPPLERLHALVWAVRERWTTPDGDQIEWAFHLHKWCQELAAGFYNDLAWPAVDALARERGITEHQAFVLLERARARHEVVRRRDRALRHFLVDGEHVSGLDTPALAFRGCSVDDARVPRTLRALWREARDLDWPERPLRVSSVARVSSWKVDAALEWARRVPEGKGALVWAWNRAAQEWAAEVLEGGLPAGRVVRCPAGRRFDALIQSDEVRGKVVVASLRGHSKGKDLQRTFARNLFLQWPRGAAAAEQTLGRTHRAGQVEDAVEVWTMHALDWEHENFDACLHDSSWIDEIEGPQKLLRANYPELPRFHPTDFLVRRGFTDLLARDRDAALRAVLGVEKTLTCRASSSGAGDLDLDSEAKGT